LPSSSSSSSLPSSSPAAAVARPPLPRSPLPRPPAPSRLHRLAPLVVRGGRRLNPDDLYGSRSSKTAGKKRVKRWQEACEAFLKLSTKEAKSVLSAFPFPPGAEDAAARARALPRSNQARKREVGLLAKFLSDDDEIDPDGTKGAEAFAAAVAAAGSGRPVGAAATAAGAAADLWRDLLLGDVAVVAGAGAADAEGHENDGGGGGGGGDGLNNENDDGGDAALLVDPVAAADRAALEKLLFGLAARGSSGGGFGEGRARASAAGEEGEEEGEEGDGGEEGEEDGNYSDNNDALLLPDAQQLRQMIRAARAEKLAALKAAEVEREAVAAAAAAAEASGGTTTTIVGSRKKAAAAKPVAGKKLLRALRAFAEVHFRAQEGGGGGESGGGGGGDDEDDDEDEED